MPHRVAQVDFNARMEFKGVFLFYYHKVNSQRTDIIAVDEQLKVVDEALNARFYLLPGKKAVDEVL
jgi:hypothetical protein